MTELNACENAREIERKSNDMINRQMAIDIINSDKTCINTPVITPTSKRDFEIYDSACERHIEMIGEMPSAQLPRMSDDDINTIRIHLSALYKSLCNQRRYREAKEYYELIARFLTFASDRPEPVKWLRDEFGSRCGACGRYAYRDKFGKPWESDFCPNCGAKMEVER